MDIQKVAMNNMLKSALVYADEHKQHNLDLLMEFIRIPSISALQEYSQDIQRAADWLSNYLGQIGMTGVNILSTGGHPVVYGEWLGAGGDKPTLLAYGHYDVQPVDPLEDWHSPPFVPTILGDNLFGRGASDDKGQLLTVLTAADSYLASSEHLPINLKVLLEGEEEIGSPHTSDFIHKNIELLACDAVLNSDYDMINPTTPAIAYGARGLLYLEVDVRGPLTDLHSGTFGGAVDNPLGVLSHLLAELRDPTTRRIKIPGFYDRVLPIKDKEREMIAQGAMTENEVIRLTCVSDLVVEEGYTTAERISVRPTLDIHGISGGFTGSGQKTVIPSSVTAKVSMRLVPNQIPDEIKNLFESYLRSLVPPTVELEVRTISSCAPVMVDYETPAISFAADACKRVFGVDPIYMRSGGSDPIAGDFQEGLDVPVVNLGFALPDDNSHAPNEKQYLPNFFRGIETMIHYFSIFAEAPM